MYDNLSLISDWHILSKNKKIKYNNYKFNTIQNKVDTR